MVAVNQVEWKGLVLGDGSPYVIRSIQGLGLPDVRTNDRPRPRDHGDEYGVDLFGGRRIGIEVAAADEALDVAVGAMLDGFGQADWLRLWLRGWPAPRQIRARARVLDPALIGGTFDYTAPLEWYAADFRIYADIQSQVTLTLAQSGVGFTFPLTFPLAFGGGASGIEILTNAGNVETWPTVRLHGPATSPRLEHVGRGQTLELAGVIPDGSFVDVDFAERTVLLEGTASRYEWVKGSFWPLDPADNEIRYTAASGTGAADLTFRSAWGG